jgi:hypothetical protein
LDEFARRVRIDADDPDAPMIVAALREVRMGTLTARVG